MITVDGRNPARPVNSGIDYQPAGAGLLLNSIKQLVSAVVVESTFGHPFTFTLQLVQQILLRNILSDCCLIC